METPASTLCHWKWRSAGGGRICKSKRVVQATPPPPKDKKPAEETPPKPDGILPPTDVDCNRLADLAPRDANDDRRQLCNERISLRPLVIRTAMNPYLLGGDYLRDLHVQDTYLRPKDSNIKEEG